MFKNTVSIGLDIGTANIKIAALKKKGKKIILLCLGIIPTPADTIEGGFIHKPEEISLQLRDLTNSLNLPRGKLTAAVSGSQVYTRLLKMPIMDIADIKNATYYQASTFLPISIDEISADVFPVRYFDDEEGPQEEIFFIAARKTQIENLYQTCFLAGFNLTTVEIEPIALYRAFNTQIGSEQIIGVVNIGANRSYIAIYVKGILVSVRSVALGSHSLFDFIGDMKNLRLPELANSIKTEQCEDFYREISIEIKRALVYFKQQSGMETAKIIICGGGSRLPSINEYLNTALRSNIEFGKISEELLLSDSLEYQSKSDLCYEYPVAIGLALRGVM